MPSELRCVEVASSNGVEICRLYVKMLSVSIGLLLRHFGME